MAATLTTTKANATSDSASKVTFATIRPKSEALPYRGPPLPNTVDDLVHSNIIQHDFDEKLWIPQQENVWFRPLLFNVSNGYFVNLLRVRKSGIVSRHRHTGPVHATCIKGSWHYLEHDWWSHPGSYAFEPPGDIHTLEVPEGVDEMVTLFHVTGVTSTLMLMEMQSAWKTSSARCRPQRTTIRQSVCLLTTSSH